MPSSSIPEMKEPMAQKAKSILFAFVTFISFVLALSACQAQSASWERIEQSGVVRVGLDPTYPPFEVTEGSGVAGLDVDLADAVARELGLTTEFVYFGYDGLYDALATEQVTF